MKARQFVIIVPVLLAAACEDSNSVDTTVPVNQFNQRLAITYLAADEVVSMQTAGSGAAGTGAAGTGAAGTGAAGAPTPTPAPTPTYQVVSTGNTTIDPNLVNAWGLAFNPDGPIWIADNGTGLATVYDAAGQILPVVVTIPTPASEAPPSAPTGLVFNPTDGFQGDKFIFSTENGTIAGWQAGPDAVMRADNSTSTAIYKGLAIATDGGVSRIYAADFHGARVDVWDANYVPIATPGFVDPGIPAGFAPFGIQAIGSNIYVSYAMQDAAGEDDVTGPGTGYVNIYSFDGVLLRRLASQGALNAPWAMAMAPTDFGTFSNMLLIGNFGDGRINAYDPNTGFVVGTALDSVGNPLVIDGLWALVFGNDTAGAAHNQLFFTGGPADETHGSFGRLDLSIP